VTNDRFTDDADDGGDDVEGRHAYHAPTWSDRVVTLRYTLWPTRYTDEDSTTTDLLWQQVLEQRGIRSWLAVGCALLLVAVGLLALAVILLVLALTR